MGTIQITHKSNNPLGRKQGNGESTPESLKIQPGQGITNSDIRTEYTDPNTNTNK